MKLFVEVKMSEEKKSAWAAWGIALIFLLALGAAADQKKKSEGVAIKIKPDLRVVRIEAERTGFSADGAHRVQVRATVANSAAGPVCAGPSAVRVEKRSPRGAYSYLGQQDAPRLCADPSRARMATATLSFEDTVPAGQQRIWRATADVSGLVSEAREDNNQAESETYVAKSFCPGVDLVATQVEIVRGTHGVFAKVYGRNRCIGSCAGAVQAVFGVVAPDVGWTSVCTRVGSTVEALQEYESGMIGVYGSSDRSVTYRIGIEFEGGACADANPANNFCEVILLPGEERKTVTCR
jgi:hypothetical protein